VTGWYMQAYDQVPFVYSTVDGGRTLTYQNIYQQSGYMMRTSQTILYTSSNVGYVAGTEIMKTTDGGTNWSINLDFGYIQGKLTELYFASPDSGYVVGEGWYGPTAMFFKTYNAGASWIQSDPPLDDSTWLTCLARPTAHALYAGAGDTWGRTLYKSTNDGDSWVVLNTTLNFHSLCFNSAMEGCAGTDSGIYRTTDGGLSWTLIQASSTAVNCLRMKNGVGFAVTADGGIFQTSNGGFSWSSMYSPVQGSVDLRHISLLSPLQAYAVGSGGTILRYSAPMTIDQSPTTEGNVLLQNVPNPCDSRTTIAYDLPTEASVSVCLYDVEGRLLRTLVCGTQTAGHHGIDVDVSGLTPGTYYYRIDTDTQSEGRRLVVDR
jgi:photosystem II stability/assembly factor-like uncharacterized protein